MLTVYAILTCLMLAVILNDTTRYLIPNWLVLALILLYPVAVRVSPARPDWRTACVIALAVFLVGFIFLFRFMGGGDIKLLTATSLYVGEEAGPQYIMLVALLGGGLAILLLVTRPLFKHLFDKLKKPELLPRVLTPGEKYMPYGAAIAIAFLILLWQGKMPGLVLFKA
jgi:prepilin peptidase CpaA